MAPDRFSCVNSQMTIASLALLVIVKALSGQAINSEFHVYIPVGMSPFADGKSLTIIEHTVTNIRSFYSFAQRIKVILHGW